MSGEPDRPGSASPVRKHAEWMAQPDDRILEFLCNHGELRTRSLRRGLADSGGNLTYPKAYVDRRCEALARYGLLTYERGSRRYEITELGEQYLEGSLDASDLPEAESGKSAERTTDEGTLDVIK